MKQGKEGDEMPSGHSLPDDNTVRIIARAGTGEAHSFPSARVAGAIGLLLMSGCGGLQQWFALNSHTEQQQVELRQELQRLDERQRGLEQEQQHLNERQRRLEQRMRRLGGLQRALLEEQRALADERQLFWESRRLEQEQRR